LSDVVNGNSNKFINDIATHACACDYYEYCMYSI